jgi:Uma2 family endonuclease
MATATTPPHATPPPDHDTLYEVVNGEIVEKKMGAYELEIASLLVGLLDPFARAHKLGRVVVEMIFWINKAKKLQRRPDVAFVSHERWPLSRRVPREAAWDIVPDLAIEIVSPSNTANEVQAKIGEYFQAGVRRVWVIYPEAALVHIYDSPTQVRILQRGDELADALLLPGFWLAVAALFDDDAEPR